MAISAPQTRTAFGTSRQAVYHRCIDNLLTSARDRKLGTVRLALMPFELAALAWAAFFGGPVWMIFVVGAILLVTTLPFMSDDMRRKRERKNGVR